MRNIDGISICFVDPELFESILKKSKKEKPFRMEELFFWRPRTDSVY